VRAAAEILKLAGFIDGDFFIGLGELLDEVALHEVAFTLELFQTFFARQKFAGVRQILLNELLHLLFDLFQIIGSKRGFAVKVVEESVLGGGAVAELGLREKFKHGGGQQVRGGMAINFKRLGVLLGEDAQVGVGFERAGEVDQIAVRLGSESGVGQDAD